MRFLIVAGLALLALAAWAQTMPVAVTGPSSTFGMVGLASGQTARLNVLNGIRNAPPVMIAQVPCRATLTFYSSDGKSLKEVTTDSLGFGKAAFLDLHRADITDLPANSRAQISAVVRPTASGAMQGLFCNLIPTLEVFEDLSGKTTVILSGPVSVSVASRRPMFMDVTGTAGNPAP